MTRVRVMITDDHLIVREGLRLILETSDSVEVVGEAQDGLDCLAQVATLHPQVILMDLQMPRLDGIGAIERLRREFPHIAIIILTTYNEDSLMSRGLRAGARGFLLKDTDRETLLRAIHAAARGELLLRPELLARLLTVADQGEVAADALSPLTEREHEVLCGAARGERSKEIAHLLGITERTVKAHLSSIYHKLEVDSRAAAVAVAAQRGLLD